LNGNYDIYYNMSVIQGLIQAVLRWRVWSTVVT